MAAIPPLQILTALLNPATAATSLDNLPAVVPTDPQSCYAYFDLFLRLAAVIATDLHGQPRYAAVLDALEQCIDQIMDVQNLNWFLDAPRSVTPETWATLAAQHEQAMGSRGSGAESNHSVLLHLYNDMLGIVPTLEVPVLSWTFAIAYFVRAATPALHAHLWLTFRNMEQTSDAILLVLLEMMEVECVKILLMDPGHKDREEQAPMRAVSGMVSILFNGDTEALALFMGCRIDSGKGEFTGDDLKALTMHLSKLVWDNRQALHNLSHFVDDAGMLGPGDDDNASNDPTPFQKLTQPLPSITLANPLTTPALLAFPPIDPIDRTTALTAGLALWTRQLATLPPSTFARHLRDLVLTRYPTDHKSTLDHVLVEWTARVPTHVHLVLQPLIDLLRARRVSFNCRASPFYAHVQMFDPSPAAVAYDVQDSTTGVRGVDPAPAAGERLDACHRTLIHLTEQNAGGELTAWIVECWYAAPACVVRRHAEWLVHNVNKHVRGSAPMTPRRNVGGDDATMMMDVSEDHEGGFHARQMRFLLSDNRTQILRADVIVPVILRTASDAAFAQLMGGSGEVAGAVVRFFDSRPAGLADRALVTDLFGGRSIAYVDALFGVLWRGIGRRQMQQQRRPGAWFVAHFLRPVVELASDPDPGSAKSAVARELIQRLFRDPDSFAYHFLGELLAARERWSTTERVFGSHLSLNVDAQSGLATLLRLIARLDRDQEVGAVALWEQAWCGNDAGIPVVPVDLVLCAMAAYPRAPTIAQHMVERMVRRVVVTTEFVVAAIDVFMLSGADAEGFEGLLGAMMDAVAKLPSAEAWTDAIVAGVIKVLADMAVYVDAEPAPVARPLPMEPPRMDNNRKGHGGRGRGKRRGNGRDGRGGRRSGRRKGRRDQRHDGVGNDSDDPFPPEPSRREQQQQQQQPETNSVPPPSPSVHSLTLRHARRAIGFLDALLGRVSSPSSVPEDSGSLDALLARLEVSTPVYHALGTCYVRTAHWPRLQQEVLGVVIAMWTRLDRDARVRVKGVLDACGVLPGEGAGTQGAGAGDGVGVGGMGI
ncbi:hypothetical protein BC936DRAFT_138683 [Jimgerdemannia flammicorona]|uniref:Uncharacterized protein n=2 Tax=Jimgerdemannia flammicorona TaxID=994334 RepID=A0A433Q6Z9_9FUNG|nr:hypothetical protein BC936DRAFT_138683 [Jimgerdemannia flammicorona]RUS25552.1 hypothetical protein BC938DRAFT_471979 [Jimgerdemannia flammicorona]